MTSRAGRRCCGFTLIEAALVAGLLGIFVALLATTLLTTNAAAERVVAEQLVGTVRTALHLRATAAVIAHGEQGWNALLDENPLGWLAGKPANYLGEYYAPDREKLPPGNWYFDRADRSLVYLFENKKSFSLRTTTFLKFKVKLSHLPDPTRSYEGSKTNTGLVFDRVVHRDAVTN